MIFPQMIPTLYGFGGGNGVSNTKFFGKSNYAISIYLNTADEKTLIGTSSNQSILNELTFNSEGGKEEITAFDGMVAIPIIDIEYVDLRCHFLAVSVIAHDMHYAFRENPPTSELKRDLFYYAKPLTETLKKTFNLNAKPLGNVFGSDESFNGDEFERTPLHLTNKGAKEKCLDADDKKKSSITLAVLTTFLRWYSLFTLSPESLPFHPKTSFAYSANENKLAYHIKGGYNGSTPLNGYVGTFNGEKWIEFNETNKSNFIDNHQIAFCYIDLGG